MKKQILFLTAMALVATACNKTDDRIDNGKTTVKGVPMVASATVVENETKLTLEGAASSWTAGDAVGIFYNDGTTDQLNYQYTADVTGASTTFTKVSDDIIISTESGATHTLVAYYPYNSAASTATMSTIPYEIPQTVTFTQTGGVWSADSKPFLLGTGTVATGGKVNFTFRHITPILELGLKGSETITSIYIGPNSETNGYYACTGTIDKDGTITRTSNAYSMTINFTGGLTLTDEVQYFQIPIGRITNTQTGLQLTFTTSSNAQYVKTILAGDYSFQATGAQPKHVKQPLSAIKMTDGTALWTVSYIGNTAANCKTVSGIGNMDRYSFLGPITQPNQSSVQVKSAWGRPSSASAAILCYLSNGVENNDWMVSSQFTIPAECTNPAIKFNGSWEYGNLTKSPVCIYIIDVDNAGSAYSYDVSTDQEPASGTASSTPQGWTWTKLSTFKPTIDSGYATYTVSGGIVTAVSGGQEFSYVIPNSFKGKNVRFAIMVSNIGEATNTTSYNIAQLRVVTD